jgi:hypothetical protein
MKRLRNMGRGKPLATIVRQHHAVPKQGTEILVDLIGSQATPHSQSPFLFSPDLILGRSVFARYGCQHPHTSHIVIMKFCACRHRFHDACKL